MSDFILSDTGKFIIINGQILMTPSSAPDNLITTKTDEPLVDKNNNNLQFTVKSKQ